MASRLNVSVDGGNVRMRFLKGLLNPQVKAKVENLGYLLPPTFIAAKAMASHHKRSMRREKSNKLLTGYGGSNLMEGEKRVTAEGTKTVKPREENFQKVILELKRELAVQKQQTARMQMDRLKHTKPVPGTPVHYA